MPTNDFIGFASAGSANIMSQADYAAAAEQTDGVQPGPASSALANKIWRQGANMASAIGQLIADNGGDAVDDGDIATLESAVEAMLKATAEKGVVDSYTAASYLRLTNGFQICMGYITVSSSGTPVTYAVPFSANPSIQMTGAPGSAVTSDYSCIAYPRSTTGFTAYINAGGAHVGGGVNYVAVGRWY